MPKSNSCNNGWLNLLLNNNAFANVGNSGGLQPSSAAGSLYFSLHNAAPGVGGNQGTNETAYTGYGRVAVARTSGGFTVSGNSATLTSTISFGQCTAGGGDTITFFGIGTAPTGAGVLLYYGAITTTTPTAFSAVTTGNAFTIPSISFTVGQQITLYAPSGSSLPGGFVQDTVYFVKTVSGDQITLSATNGGSVITVSADGEGMASLVTPLVVTSSPAVTPQLTTSLTLTEQ